MPSPIRSGNTISMTSSRVLFEQHRSQLRTPPDDQLRPIFLLKPANALKDVRSQGPQPDPMQGPPACGSRHISSPRSAFPHRAVGASAKSRSSVVGAAAKQQIEMLALTFDDGRSPHQDRHAAPPIRRRGSRRLRLGRRVHGITPSSVMFSIILIFLIAVSFNTGCARPRSEAATSMNVTVSGNEAQRILI